MLKHLSPLAAVAVFALASGTAAQEAETPEAETAQQEEAAPENAATHATQDADDSAEDNDAAAGSDAEGEAAPAEGAEGAAPAEGEAPAGSADDPQLDLGQPITSGDPQPGQRYSKEKFGSWDLACIKTETDEDPCSLLQVLHDDDDNPVAEISLFRIKGEGQAVAGASVIVPLETLLPAQLTISVDGGTAKRYSYAFCTDIGCVAQIGLTQEDVDTFKRGKGAEVKLRPAPAPDHEVVLNLSLDGFTAGYDVVDVVEQ